MPDDVAIDHTALQDVGHDPSLPVQRDPGALGFEIHARFAGGNLRLSAGERLAHRWLQDAGAITRTRRVDHPSLGRGVEVLVDGVVADDLWMTGLSQAYDLEVELVGLQADNAAQALVVLEFALTDPAEARDVAQLMHAPFLGWASPWGVDLGPELASTGVRGFDLRLATHRLDSLSFCLRNVRAVYSARWLVTLWGEPIGETWTEHAGYQALPGRGGTRPYPGRTALCGFDGEARLAALIQDIVWHNHWTSETLGAAIEEWDGRFYCAATADGTAGPAETAALERELAWLGQFAGELHAAERTMRRRLAIREEFPALIKEEVERCCDVLADQIAQLRQDVRDGFSLLTSVSARQQATFAEQRQSADRRFQLVAALVAATVLVPGLVAAFYGANVQGLPGLNQTAGLWYMVGAALVGAVVTLAVVLLALRSRPVTPLQSQDRLPAPSRVPRPIPSQWPRRDT